MLRACKGCLAAGCRNLQAMRGREFCCDHRLISMLTPDERVDCCQTASHESKAPVSIADFAAVAAPTCSLCRPPGERVSTRRISYVTTRALAGRPPASHNVSRNPSKAETALKQAGFDPARHGFEARRASPTFDF
jgi:hypothetical protein